MTDSSFGAWLRHGVSSFKDLFINGLFASFEEIAQRFNIPRSHFYRYLQIRSFISSDITQFPSQPPDTLLASINNVPSSRRKIGSICSLLMRESMTNLNSLKNEWEKDLGIDISESIWSKMVQGIHKSSICMKHAVMQFKIFHRLHWTKVKLSQFTPNIDPMCDRCRQAQATLIHMFWECPKISTFWKLIFDLLSKITDKSLGPSTPLAVLGVVTQNPEQKYNKPLVVCHTGG